MNTKKERAVVTVIGKDQVGILAKVSGACAEAYANVTDVTQSVLEDYFCMIMIIDTSQSNCTIHDLQGLISKAVPTMNVHVMHESIFDAMHRI